MTELSAGLMVAVGTAALLAAIAFRQLIGSLIRLNDELQEMLRDRREMEAERDTLNNGWLNSKLNCC